ncbi:protein ripply3 isoform X7 [Oryctolagus cuniculus]|uniref:protein ripply3 isoform X7 n=1 Tax=Oryctolagus cuniculus TaxID=9986 RepID=UPI003879364A
MRPETEAGAPEARGRGCHCPGDGFQVRPPPHGPESRTPWRPWTLTSRGAQLTPTGSPGRLEPGGDQQALGSKGAFGFQHPVRGWCCGVMGKSYRLQCQHPISSPSCSTSHPALCYGLGKQ